MIASVHVADVGARLALGVLRRVPKASTTPGLRSVKVALAAPLGASLMPKPQFGRVGMIAFWDDDAALDGFLSAHPLAPTLAQGWRVRLAPLRAHGTWPGLPADVPTARTVDHEGPAAVVTLGRFRLTRVVPFFRASAKAAGAVVAAPGLTWATGLALPPFVATCSLWEHAKALSTYAYGGGGPAHPDAIAANTARPFHHQSAFIRFRPYDSVRGLVGRNPLDAHWMD